MKKHSLLAVDPSGCSFQIFPRTLREEIEQDDDDDDKEKNGEETEEKRLYEEIQAPQKCPFKTSHYALPILPT